MTQPPRWTSKSNAPESSQGVFYARWSLFLLLAINLFNYIDRYILAAVEDEIQREFGSSDATTGMLATAFLLSYMCFAPLFGWLAGRYRRWLLVGVGVVLWSIASGASGLATGIVVMLLTRAFVGIGEAAYGPVAPTIIADLYPIQRRGRVLAWFYVAIPVGSALGYLLGGRVLAMGFSWHWAFYVVVPPGLLLGALALMMRDPRRSNGGQIDTPPPERKTKLETYKHLLSIRSYRWNTLGMTAMTFAMGGIAFWIPKYIVWRKIADGTLDPLDELARKAATADANSIFGPIVVVSGLIGTLAGGWLGDKLRPRWPGSYFIVSGIAMLISFPLILLLPFTPFPAAWTLIFIACLGLFFNTGPTNTILANVTHPTIRASGYALNIFIIHALGDAISPPLIGAVNDASEGNMNAGFITVSFAILLSGLCWLRGSRYLEQDTLGSGEEAA